MRLGWSVISPGDRPRGQVLAEQGRGVVSVAVGLVGVLLVSGLIEALVTPSPLPTFVRVGIGVIAEVAFLSYIVYFGRRAVKAGETGDIDDAPDVVPTVDPHVIRSRRNVAIHTPSARLAAFIAR